MRSFPGGGGEGEAYIFTQAAERKDIKQNRPSNSLIRGRSCRPRAIVGRGREQKGSTRDLGSAEREEGGQVEIELVAKRKERPVPGNAGPPTTNAPAGEGGGKKRKSGGRASV